jgi:hypothetical protein
MPIEDLIRLKNLSQSIQNALPRQAPPPTTVAADIKGEVAGAIQQAQQTRAQQEQMQRMAAMQQAAPRGPQMPPPGMQQAAPQGIPSLPVSNVGQPQRYARGGIVAFAGPEGSLVGETSELAFSKHVTELMKKGVPELEARSMASKLLKSRALGIAGRGLGATGAIAGPAMAFSDIGNDPSYTKQWFFERGIDPSKLTEEEQIRAGEAMGAQAGLNAMLMGIPGAIKSGWSKLKGLQAQNRNPALAAGQRMTEMIQQQNAAARAGRNAAVTDIDPIVNPAPLSSPAALAQTPAAPVASPVASPKDFAAFLAEQNKIAEEQGIGKALSDRETYLKKREDESDKEFAKRANLSKAQAFFKMAEESAKPGGTFLKGATAGLSDYAGAKQALMDRREAQQDRIAEIKFTLESAREQQKLGNIQAARVLHQRAEDKQEELAKESRTNEESDRRLRLRNELDLAAEPDRKMKADAYKANLDMNNPQLPKAERDKAKARYELIMGQLEQMERARSSYLAAMLRAESNDPYKFLRPAQGGPDLTEVDTLVGLR